MFTGGKYKLARWIFRRSILPFAVEFVVLAPLVLVDDPSDVASGYVFLLPWILLMALTSDVRSVHLPLILFWCAALAWNWYILLGIPYEIRFDAPGLLSFVSLRGTTSLPAAKLHSLKPYRGGGGVYVLHYEGGKIRLIAQMTGFHEAIIRIKAANPNFEVVGI